MLRTKQRTRTTVHTVQSSTSTIANVQTVRSAKTVESRRKVGEKITRLQMPAHTTPVSPVGRWDLGLTSFFIFLPESQVTNLSSEELCSDSHFIPIRLSVKTFYHSKLYVYLHHLFVSLLHAHVRVQVVK